MKLITRDTDYAVRALTYMASHKDKTIPVSELVKALKIPRPFLRKILQILNKKRILNSLKGQGGGFNLAVAADKIFVADLIEIFQGPLKINECIFKRRVCPGRNTCMLKMKIDAIEDYVIKQLRSITLKDVL